MVFRYGDSHTLPPGQEKITSTDNFAGVPLGTRAMTQDGRVFRYCFSAGAIGAGFLTTHPALIPSALSSDLILVTAAVGARSVTASHASANAATINFYKDGYLIVNDGAGEGHLYLIQGHDASASDAVAITLRLGDDVVREALASGSSLGGIVRNPYTEIVEWPTTGVGPPAGVAPTEIADNTFFWNQTWGYAMVLYKATSVIITGRMVQASDGQAGAIEGHSVGWAADASVVPAIPLDEPIIGIAATTVQADGDYQFTFLTIAA